MIKESKADRLLKTMFYLCIGLFSVYCLVPFWSVIASSFTSEASLVKNGYMFWPSDFSLDAYKMIFKDNTIYRAYGVTTFVTAVGTVLSMIFTSAMAYTLSVKSVKYRNHLAFYIYFTMLFHGGLVASYLLISKYLDMKDTIWVLIIPGMISAWNMFLLRNFFASIDDSIAESAKIDGANDVYILFRIILPISLPALATIGLFYALGYWNKWFDAVLYINDKDLFPLQYLIQRIMNNLDYINQISSDISIPNFIAPAMTVRLATTVVTIGPIIFLYPFLQKYFVKGLMVGAVKG
ncbi:MULTISPECIES: carbohydrate ABC transporter permease [unclassified Paenibacillus]|uniref:carbohydrate ABC transporter permease n=1 Tax=unclassified Paenibacillus TaxID=185978 RepID=UPI00240590B8|nr:MULTISPECIES: carbohydrate ABC transporter permease [unclassified Paenibacillus]MDF9839375.1 putative aldouronate transport system permease protein [Paenibacillus sp. PastF-2]MDF9845956.1 putative aldouronate transport system permease protein [Paenibacillus sp. PastM-2]MDF9852529.1 putative aldouronate transport system permease protein [Paenibacillus sp. PastF-1]MDH6477741.1 putative aldouronate transport system permease protein [Paenibacillus sp. PastH-2]MDH6505480.1 putative aldouronate t